MENFSDSKINVIKANFNTGFGTVEIDGEPYDFDISDNELQGVIIDQLEDEADEEFEYRQTAINIDTANSLSDFIHDHINDLNLTKLSFKSSDDSEIEFEGDFSGREYTTVPSSPDLKADISGIYDIRREQITYLDAPEAIKEFSKEIQPIIQEVVEHEISHVQEHDGIEAEPQRDGTIRLSGRVGDELLDESFYADYDPKTGTLDYGTNDVVLDAIYDTLEYEGQNCADMLSIKQAQNTLNRNGIKTELDGRW